MATSQPNIVFLFPNHLRQGGTDAAVPASGRVGRRQSGPASGRGSHVNANHQTPQGGRT